MFLFERAAELKAKTELGAKLSSHYVQRTTIWVAYTSYEIITDWVKQAWEPVEDKNQTLQRTARFKRKVDQSGPDLSQCDSQQDLNSASNTNPFSSQALTSSTTKIPTSAQELQQDAALQEQFRLFQLMLMQQSQTVAPAAVAAVSLPSALPASRSNIPQCPYLPGFIGPDGQLIPIQQHIRTTTPLPRTQTTKPSNSVSNGLDLSELKNRPLRKVGDVEPSVPKQSSGPGGFDLSELKSRPLRKVGESAPPVAQKAPNSGFDLSELKSRPLRKVNRDTDNINNNTDSVAPIPLPELRPVRKQEEAFKVQGKRVVSSNIPGEENMSFTERIKIASKMSLRTTAGQRSPGGTPRRDKKLIEETPFVLALRDKFKNCRDSVDPQTADDTDGDWR